MVEKQVEKKRGFQELPPNEKTQICRNIRYYVRLDKKSDETTPVTWSPDNPFGIFSGGYTKNRRMRGRETNPGYNELHGVDFRGVTRGLMQRFPGETISVLDIGCGAGIFGMELQMEMNSDGKQNVKARGTNIRVEKSAIPTDVMIGENLKYNDNSFHLVVTTYAATKYTGRLDLVLEEMYRVTKPGGEVHFQGESEIMSKEAIQKAMHEFEQKHNIKIQEKQDGLEAYWFKKP
ncbi:MAG: class I SAM-dependent methyltransferase [Candidatus Altiarchaeota archaeon]|nr:class I SAM-dependent methyltransferase [Candidatus Altiarchaeota archaeon]